MLQGIRVTGQGTQLGVVCGDKSVTATSTATPWGEQCGQGASHAAAGDRLPRVQKAAEPRAITSSQTGIGTGWSSATSCAGRLPTNVSCSRALRG